MKRTTVKKLEKLSYAEMVKLDDFHDRWFEAMVKRVCVKCRKPNSDNNEGRFRTGLCRVCELEMNDADKKAFNEFDKFWNVDMYGIPCVANMDSVVFARGFRKGRELGMGLLKNAAHESYEYKRGFANGVLSTIIKEITSDVHFNIW